jgi:hypothetical protein
MPQFVLIMEELIPVDAMLVLILKLLNTKLELVDLFFNNIFIK